MDKIDRGPFDPQHRLDKAHSTVKSSAFDNTARDDLEVGFG